jgi:hypothetical protein
MALINKTGITTGGTVQAEHVTRAIDALSGGSTDSVSATGSFSGSLNGVVNITAASTLNSSLTAGATQFGGINLTNATKGTGFILPSNPTGTTPPAGSMYWDDVAGLLYVYQASTATWLAWTPA